jgi:hypothetical protein
MPLILRPIAVLLAALLFAACAGGAPSSPSPAPPAPADAAALLRVTMIQAVPPLARFPVMPQVVITLDGRVLTGGAVPAIYPGPLVMPVVERRITPAGWAKVVAAARDAGLLGGLRDFTGGQLPPGSATLRLELVADGKVHALQGDPGRQMVCVTAPCVPPPGTPEAFTGFVAKLPDLGSWLAADLGPEAMHTPAAYAIIVREPPAQEPGLPQPAIDWPFAVRLAQFGKALAGGVDGRCGTVTGTDVGVLRPPLAAANQLTRWRDPADGTLHGLVVRPLLPGDEDPCAGLV